MPNHPDYLRRLHQDSYQGIAYVHWTHTIEQRKSGWLTADFHQHFQSILTHSAFLYDLDIPCYCLMPDHFHLLAIGNNPTGSNQLNATRWIRKRINWLLSETQCDNRAPAFTLQKQAYDNVLREKDRQRDAFPNVCDYIRDNPRRAGLVSENADRSTWEFQGCVVPERPLLRWSDDSNTNFREEFWHVHYLKIDRNFKAQP